MTDSGAAPRAPAPDARAPVDLRRLFIGGSETAARCRGLDWAATPLGPVAGWPAALRTVAAVVLGAPVGMVVLWGPEHVQLYNDSYAAIMGAEHPAGLGQPSRVCWPEVWGFNAPIFDAVRREGRAFTFADQRLMLERHGAPEETFFTLSFSPVPDDDGTVGGILATVFETTAQVRGRAAEAERARLATALDAERLGLLEAVFREAPSFLHVLRGPDFVFEFANEAYYRLVGRRDLLGRPAFEALPEAAGNGFPERLAAVLATGEPFVGRELPVLLARTPGAPPEERRVDLVYLRLTDAPDGQGRVLGHGIDVTDPVRARAAAGAALVERTAAAERAVAALAASEARFRAVQDASPQGFGLHQPVRDAAGRVVDFRIPYVNAAGARLAGRTAAEIQAGTQRTLWPATDTEGIFADLVRVLETGEPSHRELRYAHDGIAAGLAITAVRIGAGPDAELGVTFADITARLRADEERAGLLAAERAARAAAEAERQRLAAVLAHLPVGVTFAEGPAGQHSVSNPAAAAIWGTVPASPDVAAYSRDFVGYRPGPGARGSAEEAARRVASHEWPLARALAAGEVVVDELAEIERPDGTRRLVSLAAAPVRDAAGRVTGALVTTTDVTEREATLRALEAARRGAEAANRAKGEFLAVMSHELRTPLNAIAGYVQLLDMGLHGPVTDAQRAALARVQAAQTRLLSLVNDVLNYARLESGRVDYDVRPVDVADVVRDVVPLVEPQLRAKGLAFDVRLPKTPCVVAADREKLGQVLLNLLSNAVKFTDSLHPGTGAPGRVVVEVATRQTGPARAVPGAAGAALAFLRVTDTGRGIAREKQDAIFEPFVQVRAGTGSAYAYATEGTGLGLAISRDLARGMGGDLRVRSFPGEGATFTVALRRVTPDAGATAPPDGGTSAAS